VATILGKNQELSTTFSRPIPAMFYHVRECLWHHIKTINSTNLVLLTAVTWQVMLQ